MAHESWDNKFKNSWKEKIGRKIRQLSYEGEKISF